MIREDYGFNWVRSMIGVDNLVSIDSLKSLRWIAVPVESGGHFDQEDINNLARAARAIGVLRAEAYLLEKWEDIPPRFDFDMTHDGLGNFQEKCGMYPYAITCKNKSFIVLCTVGDYFLVMGKRGFVQDAVGSSIEKARKKFDEYVSEETMPKIKNWLEGISRRYKY